jgi:uncharacterized protein YceK
MKVRGVNGWAKILVVVMILFVLVAVSGCGTLINGSVQKDMRGNVDGVALILNILFFWPGLIIDLITGGFWKVLPGGSIVPRSP